MHSNGFFPWIYISGRYRAVSQLLDGLQEMGSTPRWTLIWSPLQHN